MKVAFYATLLALSAGCEQPRTQMMVGVVTDIRAPNLIDGAQLTVTRAKDGFIEQQVNWDISGVPNQPFNLPGSYGIYSDGEEIQLDIVLTGTKGGNRVVDRRAVLNLVEGKTLFFRMSLTAGCIAKADCLETQSCVEGVCRDVNVNARQLPDFSDTIVTELTCNSGSAFIDTSTGAPLPLSADADQCPPHLCIEGTCLKPPPPEEGDRVVTGTQFTTFVQAAKVTNVPANLSQLEPRALVPNDDGSFTEIEGTGSSDGTFVIPAVPKGLYYLNVGKDYFITHASNFDLTRAVTGRPDVVEATLPTTINFQNVTGLDPWQPEDELEFMSPDSNLWMFQAEGFVPIADNTTALVDYSITNQDIAGFTGQGSLVRNDPFFALQMRANATPGGHGYKAATKIFTPPPFTQTNGGTTNLNGTFTAIPQTSMTNATFPGTQWDQLLGYSNGRFMGLHPNATEFPGFESYTLVVHGQIGGALYGLIGATVDYLLSAFPHGRDVNVAGMQFGIPTLPGQWATAVDIRTTSRVVVQLPGTTTASRLFVGASRTALFSQSSGLFEPQMGPARSLRIDNQDAFGTLGNGICVTPTITWQAPTLGKPVFYTVNIFRFFANGTTTQRELAGAFYTTDTTLVVPPGVLQLGQTYAFNVTASTTPNPEAPFRFRFPEAQTTAGSSLFVPTTTCIGTGGGGGSDVDPTPERPDAAVPQGPDSGGSGGGSIDAAP